MKNFVEALRLAVVAAIEEFRFVRHMQKGGNPDVLDF
jgi:hypothetical protein